MFKKLDILHQFNLFGSDMQTVSLDTSLLPDNTLKYMWSGKMMQICYPVINNGKAESVYLPIKEDGLRYNDEFAIDKQKTPVVYFTCKDTQRLYIYGYNKDLISCRISIVQSLDFDVTCAGELIVKTCQYGKYYTDTYSNPNGEKIYKYSDAGKGAHLIGNVVKLTNWTNDTFAPLYGIYVNSDTLAWLALGKSSMMKQLDLSRAPKLQILEIWGESLQTLDISQNILLTSLSLYRCNKLFEIYTRAINNTVAGVIANFIENSGRTGVIHCRKSDAYYSTIQAAAQGAGWTIYDL